MRPTDKRGTFQAQFIEPGDVIPVDSAVFRPDATSGKAYAYVFRQMYDTANHDAFTGFTLMEITTPEAVEKMRPRPEHVYKLPQDHTTGLPGAGTRDYVVVMNSRQVPARAGDFIERLGSYSGSVQDALSDHYQKYNLERHTIGYIGGSDAWDSLNPGTFIQKTEAEFKERPERKRTNVKRTAKVKHSKKHGTLGAPTVGSVIDLSLEDAVTHYGLPKSIADTFQSAVTLRGVLNLGDRERNKLLTPAAKSKKGSEISANMKLIDAAKAGLFTEKDLWVLATLQTPDKGHKKINTLSEAFNLSADDLTHFGGVGISDLPRLMGLSIRRAQKRFSKFSGQSTPTTPEDTVQRLKEVLKTFMDDYVANKPAAKAMACWTVSPNKK